MMKNKKMLIIIGAIIIAFVGWFLIKRANAPAKNKEVQSFVMDDKTYVMKQGDRLVVNDDHIKYNGKRYDDVPVIYNGITLGSDYEDVLKAYGIKKGYAFVDSEVDDPMEDGTTDVIRKIYDNDKIFKGSYLDVMLIFGYVNKGGEWVLTKYDELEEYEDKDKDIIGYKIIFDGLNKRTKGKVVGFEVEYK